MNYISSESDKLNIIREKLEMRYPALQPLLARCRKPARDAQILEFAFVNEESFEQIARKVGVSKAIVSHVVRAARRYLLDYALQQCDEESLESELVAHLGDSGALSSTPVFSESNRPPIAEEHVDAQLLGLVLGYVPPLSAIHQHLARHLVRCSRCQIALATLIGALSQSRDPASSTNRPLQPAGQRMLLDLQATLQRTNSRGKALQHEAGGNIDGGQPGV